MNKKELKELLFGSGNVEILRFDDGCIFRVCVDKKFSKNKAIKLAKEFLQDEKREYEILEPELDFLEYCEWEGLWYNNASSNDSVECWVFKVVEK